MNWVAKKAVYWVAMKAVYWVGSAEAMVERTVYEMAFLKVAWKVLLWDKSKAALMDEKQVEMWVWLLVVHWV